MEDLSVGGSRISSVVDLHSTSGHLSPVGATGVASITGGGRRALLTSKPLKELKCLSCQANLLPNDLKAGNDPIAWDSLPEMKSNPVN